MKKIILFVILTILLLSLIIIPCFAEYNGEWSKSYPFLYFGDSFAVDYYNYVNGTVQGSLFNVNYLSRIRYFYYNGSNSDGDGDSAFLELFNTSTALHNAYSISYTNTEGSNSATITTYNPSSFYPRFLLMFDDDSHCIVDMSKKSGSYTWDYSIVISYDQTSVSSLTQIDLQNVEYIYLKLTFRNSGADYNIVSGNLDFYSTNGYGFIYYPLYVSDDYTGYVPRGFNQHDSYDGVVKSYKLKCITLAYPIDIPFDMYACNSTANEQYSLKVYEFNQLPSPSDPEYNEDDFKLIPLIFAIFESPSILLSSVLNFEIFGINFYYLILGLVTAILTFVVVKIILKFAKYMGA